jgi:hypothetical protein
MFYEGPRGADVYVLLNVATECSRNYAKNIHRGFNCSRVMYHMTQLMSAPSSEAAEQVLVNLYFVSSCSDPVEYLGQLTRTVPAPKLADMVRAQNFLKCSRRKPILQVTVA